MNLEAKVFPNKETFDKIYDEYCENIPQTTEDVRSSYGAMQSAFETYLLAVEEYWFRHAYLCGYEAGRNEGALRGETA